MKSPQTELQGASTRLLGPERLFFPFGDVERPRANYEAMQVYRIACALWGIAALKGSTSKCHMAISEEKITQQPPTPHSPLPCDAWKALSSVR